MTPIPRLRPFLGSACSLALAGLLLTGAGCSGDANGGLDASLIHTVARGDLKITIRERGEVSAANDKRVVSELEGRATLIYLIPEGTSVTAGTKLAEMDASSIVEKRTSEEIAVAKVEAAVQQARKNVEIVEKELLASEMAAESALEIALLRAKKLMGQPRSEHVNNTIAGTNGQIIEELRNLVADVDAPEPPPLEPLPDGAPAATGMAADALARAERARQPVSTDLVDKVLALFESQETLELQMGEIGNQILQQISQINLARSDLEVAADTLAYTEQLTAEGFMTRNELSRDRINYSRRIAETNLAWNNLDLLVNYTIPELKITSRQEVSNAGLTLESVRATAEARRVREASELTSAESEFEVARKRLATWNEQIENAVLYAPSDGLVVYGRFDWDEPVYEGMEIRERQEVVILPDVSTMVAELLVHEAQVDQVAVGQRVSLEVDAFPERQFTANVASVSTLPDVRGSWRRDVKVYAVRVEVEGGNPESALRPGMNSTITIDVGTLKDIVAIPLPALERKKDRHYVWSATRSGPVAREVTVGANNLTHVEIVAGLEAGDRVYLVPPVGVELPDKEPLVPTFERDSGGEPATEPATGSPTGAASAEDAADSSVAVGAVDGPIATSGDAD